MNDDDKKLDQLLKEWDQQKKPVFRDKSELKAGIMEQIRKTPLEERPEERPKGTIITPVYWICAVAAMFVCISIGWIANMNFSGSNDKETPMALAQLSTAEMAELEKIKSEVKQVFPNGVAWVFKLDNEMDITPLEFNHEAAKTSKQLLIHHVVMKKENGTWRRIYKADIMTAPGQSISYQKGGNKTYLWSHQVDKENYALEGKLTIKVNGSELNLEFFGGQGIDQTCLLKKMEKDGRQYRVYQTIRRL